MSLIVDAYRFQIRRHSHCLEEELSGFGDGFFRNSHVVFTGQIPDIASVRSKDCLVAFVEDMFHPDRSQDRKAFSMGDVIERGEFMLHRMYAPCRLASVCDKAVDRVASCPHQVRSRVIIIRLIKGSRTIFDARLQDSFRKALLYIRAFLMVEIVLEGMAHHVSSSGCSLLPGNCIGIGRIQHGHLRGHKRRTGSPFLILRHIGNDCECVHLRACRGQSQDRIDRERSFDQRWIQNQIPGITVIDGTGCDNLGAVDRTSSANCKDHIDSLCPAHLHALSHRLNTRIGLNA